MGGPRLTADQRAQVLELRRRRVSQKELAERFDVSVDTIVRELRRAGVGPRDKHSECARDCSTPPPPPPGFDERDLHTGKPLL